MVYGEMKPVHWKDTQGVLIRWWSSVWACEFRLCLGAN